MAGLLLGSIGCRSLPVLPTPMLDSGDWNVRRGQAVWTPGAKKQPVAGDLTVATNRTGNAMVEFTKMPFPTIIAQTAAGKWQLQFFPQNRTWTAPGDPPGRIVWFQLERALNDRPLRNPWQFKRTGPNEWSLENRTSGESLRGFLR